MKLLKSLSTMYAIRVLKSESELNDITNAYEDGFKKARELAADKFKNGVSPNSRMIHKELLNLGE